MTIEQVNYRVIPGVVKAGENVTVHIEPLGAHARFDCVNRRMTWRDKWDHLQASYYKTVDTDARYTITVIPMEESNEADPSEAYEVLSVVPNAQGGLDFTKTFATEQEYILEIREAIRPDYRLRLHIYAVNEDLYGKHLYKGDFHVHTHYSDGREDPGVVVANYRKQGFDLLAITDHHKRFPSEEAVEIYEKLPVDIQIYHGEEVHEPGGYIHALNIEGSGSVNELYLADPEKAEQEILEIAAGLTLPEGLQRIDAARRIWISEKVHAYGGMSILVHPHWINNAYNMRDGMTRYLLKSGVYDAFELLGGQSVHENNIQVALYQDLRAEGARIPAVANSDSHGTEPAVYFDWVSTLILADSASFEDVYSAVQGLCSVAVESYPNETYRVYGPYRLVKYIRYLMEYYMPRHNEMCYEEGRLMKQALCGSEGERTKALSLLTLLKGQTQEWQERFFGA